MPPDPPSGSRLRRSRAPPLILPLLRHCTYLYSPYKGVPPPPPGRMIQLLPSYFSAMKRAASSPTSGLLLYNITWIAESTNANWSVRPCWTKLFTAMQPDWKSKLQVFCSCSSASKVVEHQIGLCFRWDRLSRPAKRPERDLPTSKRTIY